MKCTITNTETNGLTNGIPLSREGRTELAEITTEYNEKLRERFLKSFIEKSGKRDDDMLEAVKKLAPQYSKKSVLKMLVESTREELFEPFKEVVVEALPEPDEVRSGYSDVIENEA